MELQSYAAGLLVPGVVAPLYAMKLVMCIHASQHALNEVSPGLGRHPLVGVIGILANIHFTGVKAGVALSLGMLYNRCENQSMIGFSWVAESLSLTEEHLAKPIESHKHVVLKVVHVAYCTLWAGGLVFAASALLSVGSPLAAMTVVASVVTVQHARVPNLSSTPASGAPQGSSAPSPTAYLTMNPRHRRLRPPLHRRSIIIVVLCPTPRARARARGLLHAALLVYVGGQRRVVLVFPTFASLFHILTRLKHGTPSF